MSVEHGLTPHRPGRQPRPGLFFSLVRLAGWLLTGGGLLLLGVALVGFLVMLVRVGPTFVASMQNLDQQFAGFVWLLSLMYLALFPVVGLVGAAMAGIGVALGYGGTRSGNT